MRCLNKVIFVNSANTPYAEVRLDGNVHFIGTQGVGKSTLLRAILFFYNGDKLKLGIPKEKKGFDDFYLPYPNSYIVYEVSHEYGPFCVLVFRSQGRACFRFIDAPYDRSWLVDPLTGDVTSEYTVIRQRLEGRHMTRIIDKYDEYRNIIYGNHHATDKEFYRFALMESPRYQNIPRSLQNVFLNSRVDADFIKEIIIRSMNDDEVGLDLAYYRKQVADFEQEYNDISIWFRQGSSVRAQADKVLQHYHSLLYHKEKIISLYSELLFALRNARESTPYLRQKEEGKLADIKRLERLLSEEKMKSDKESADINKAIGEVEGRLRDIRHKRRHYEDIGIESVLARVESEYEVRSSLESQTKVKETLTREFQSLTAKYESLETTIRTTFADVQMRAKENIASAREQATDALERLGAKRESSLAAMESEIGEAMALLKERADEHQLKERDLEKELVRLGYLHPLQTEMDALKSDLDNLQREEGTLKAEEKNLELEINVLLGQFEAQKSSLERDRDALVGEYEGEKEEFKAKIEQVNALLKSAEGSLYEWLEANSSGWKQTFGKLVDPAKVLYNKNLHPVSVPDASDTVFGVRLDLGTLEADVRTPDELKQEKQMYADAITDIEVRIAEVVANCEKKVKALSDKSSPTIKELRRNKSLCEAKLSSLPERIKAAQVRLKALQDKEAQMLSQRKEELDERRKALSAVKAEIDSKSKNIMESSAKKAKAIDKEYADSRSRVLSERDASVDRLTASIQTAKAEMEASLKDLGLRKEAELKGAGVDTEALNACEAEIFRLRSELKYIDDNRTQCIEYQMDKRDLFDKEDEFKDKKNALEAKRAQLAERYALRGKKLQDQLDAAHGQLREIQKDINDSADGVKKAEEFQSGPMFPSYLSGVVEHATLSPVLSLVEELREAVMERSEIMNHFKQAVNVFKGNFGPSNTFKFRTNISTDDEYMDYAAGLDEFISQNKIEDYRNRTSDRYLEILLRVSREIGELMRHGSEVEKIIHDINFDFKDKNFVGAIKRIEIRRADSGDKMVHLLLKIKEFSDENAIHLGGVNLFSDVQENAAVNKAAVRYLQDFMGILNEYAQMQTLSLSDTFQLQFRVVENDNDTGWVEKIANVGSDGTDILVKAMVNIMLINVFKEKVSRKFGEFRIHCMMDEIGKLHPSNVKGILDFANSRNILLINSSPTTYNVSDYRYTYLLSKNSESKTAVTALITRKEAELRR